MVEKTLRRVGLSTLCLIAMAVMFCNIDWFVAPYLARKLGHVWLGYRVAMISMVSCGGALYIYWFGRLLDKIILEYEQQGRTMAILAVSPHRWDRIKAWVICRHKKVLDPGNKKLMRIKHWGYPAAFSIGIIPEFLPGSRSTLIGFCAATDWRSGFVLYLVADLLKNIGMSAILGKLFHH